MAEANGLRASGGENAGQGSPCLSIRDLSVEFDTDEGVVPATDRVNIDVFPGEFVGLVGESGCGKTVTAMSVLRLVPSPPGRVVSGRILFDKMDLLTLHAAVLRNIRGERISMIFQEPQTSLNPLHRVGKQLMEGLMLHRPGMGKAERRAMVLDWLSRVGLSDPGRQFDAWPHELSGGMRQRVMIAMAMMLGPELLVADEPTTALDVTIQAQILDLMRRMHAECGMAVLFITHDLAVVAGTCGRVVVMYAGRVAENAPVGRLFAAPAHPYTRALLRSIPTLAGGRGRLASIPGQVPNPRDYGPGCRFCDRCAEAFGRCREEPPPVVEVAPGHEVSCWRCVP